MVVYSILKYIKAQEVLDFDVFFGRDFNEPYESPGDQTDKLCWETGRGIAIKKLLVGRFESFFGGYIIYQRNITSKILVVHVNFLVMQQTDALDTVSKAWL